MKWLLASFPLVAFAFLLPPQEQKSPAGRAAMIKELVERDITDRRVLAAMSTVPRHLFVPQAHQSSAYADRPLPIGEGQTISQPYVVALMTQELRLDSTDKVLEIGSGSGYQAAVLAAIVDSVFTIEIKCKLADRARQVLSDLSCDNVQVKCADGYYGWQEHAPFDAIIITCAVNHVPAPLLAQLKVGGRLILPLGSTRFYQTLTRLTKHEKEVRSDYLGTVAFVPMTGFAGES